MLLATGEIRDAIAVVVVEEKWEIRDTIVVVVVEERWE
jgi:hypothetical protein